MKKRRKPYQPKPIKKPVTGLRDMIAMQMHASAVGIEAGSLDSFDALSKLVNMIGLAIFMDPKFEHENRLMRGGAENLNDVGRLLEANLRPKPHHMAGIRSYITMFDQLLPRLDVMRLYRAERIANQAYEVQQAVIEQMMEKRKNLCI